jgi:hypothetical protein
MTTQNLKTEAQNKAMATSMPESEKRKRAPQVAGKTAPPMEPTRKAPPKKTKKVVD